jgi:hypothetical protein
MRRLAYGHELQRALREGRSIVSIRSLNLPQPSVVPRVSEGNFSLDLDEAGRDQLSLGVVAQTLRGAGWNISNSYSQISPARIFSQLKHYGAKALIPGQHWYLRRYRAPIVIDRGDQVYKNGFDAFVRLLDERYPSSNPPAVLSMRTLDKLSQEAIGSTLPPDEAHRYFLDRR